MKIISLILLLTFIPYNLGFGEDMLAVKAAGNSRFPEIDQRFNLEKHSLTIAVSALLVQVRNKGFTHIMPVPNSGNYAAEFLVYAWEALYPDDDIPKIVYSSKSPITGIAFDIGYAKNAGKVLIIDDVVEYGRMIGGFEADFTRSYPLLSYSTAAFYLYSSVDYGDRPKITYVGEVASHIRNFWYRKILPEEKNHIRNLLRSLAEELARQVRHAEEAARSV